MSNIADIIKQARDSRDINSLIPHVPYAKLLGMQCQNLGDELLFILPAKEENIGNPTLPAIHGGAIGGFMENAALFHVIGVIETETVPRVVDFSLDYLRAGRFQDIYASCEVVRQGRTAVNIFVSAWQNVRSEPIATARTHVLL